MHVAFVVLIGDDDDLAATGVPLDGFHAPFDDFGSLIEALPPARPDLAFKSGVARLHGGMEVILIGEAAITLLEVLHENLMLVYQTVAHRRRFFESVAIHHLDVHLRHEGLQRLRP